MAPANTPDYALSLRSQAPPARSVVANRLRLSGFQKVFVSHSVEETESVGVSIGKALGPSTIIGLKGPLGAGKTVLAKGIIRGLGCSDPVTSPTFVLVQKYFGRLPVWHVDLYRLEKATWDDLGIEDEMDNGITVVEWAERFTDLSAFDIWIDVETTAQGGRNIQLRSSKGEFLI